MRLEPEDIRELQPLIAEAVRQTLDQMQANAARLPADRLAFSESESANLLGIAKHTLRDMRQRGEISAVRCGKQYRYARQVLLDFLNP